MGKRKGRFTRMTTLRRTKQTSGDQEFFQAIITLYQLQCEVPN